MAELIRYILLVLGAVYIVTQSSIAAPVRQRIADVHPLLEALVYCGACSGFWIGAALYQTWPYAVRWPALEAAVAGCMLGALWSGYFVPYSAWEDERGSTTQTDLEN